MAERRQMTQVGALQHGFILRVPYAEREGDGFQLAMGVQVLPSAFRKSNS